MNQSQPFPRSDACTPRVFRSPKSTAGEIMSRTLIGVMLLCGTVRASTIELNLGPSNDRVHDQLITPFGSGITSLAGQTVSIDFTFSGDSFVHLYQSTSSTFSIQPMLQLNGTGTILDVVGQAYTFDSLHQQNSPLWSFGGGSVTADGTFNFGLGYIFPLLNENGGSPSDGTPLDFYGAHFEFVLPDAPGFEILGAQFDLFSNGTRGHDYFAIGPHVPDSGSTFALFALVLTGLWIARRGKEKRPIAGS
jgi:VPDSG-CTERM motif